MPPRRAPALSTHTGCRMLRLNVSADVADLKRKLSYIEREQVPFAASMAINETGNDVARAITAQMDQYLENPTPFTKAAYITSKGRFKGKFANKRNLVAILIPGKVQAEYLRFQIAGGTRTPKQKAILVPTRAAPKNQYGNLTKSTRKALIAGKRDFFSAGAREKKTPGIYKKIGTEEIQPMAFYVDSATYRPIFPIDKISAGVVRNRFPKNLQEAIKKALSTAR